MTVSGTSARQLNLYYGTGLMGRFTRIEMTRNADGSYGAVIPPFAKAEYVRYYIKAIADDEVGRASYSPVGAEHDVYIYQVEAAVAVTSSVVINELMTSNISHIADELGNFGDWIELYNTSDQAVDLSGWLLSDQESNIERWAFPAGSVINGKSTLVVWADGAIELTSGLHAAFRLSAAGESLYLVTPDKASPIKLFSALARLIAVMHVHLTARANLCGRRHRRLIGSIIKESR